MSSSTMSCLMEKKNACHLYTELVSKVGKTNMINVDCVNPVIFETNMYEDDNNEIYSWGYKGLILNWKTIRKITDNYKCNFSQHPHTSIQYTKKESELTPERLITNQLVVAELALVNICSDNPDDWHIIEM